MKNFENEHTFVHTNSEQYIFKQARSIRRLFIAASILIPATMIFGPFAAGAALICSIYGFVKLQKVSKISPSARAFVQGMKSLGIICICISAIAFILTMSISFLVIPLAMEALSTGDLSMLESGLFGPDGLNIDDSNRTDTWG